MSNILVTNLTSSEIVVCFWLYGQLQRVSVPAYGLNIEMNLDGEMLDNFVKTAEKNYPKELVVGKQKLDKVQELNMKHEEERLDKIADIIDEEIENKVNAELSIHKDPNDSESILSIEVSDPYKDSKSKTNQSKPRGRKSKSS